MIRNNASSRVTDVMSGEIRLNVRLTARDLPLTQLARECIDEARDQRPGEPFDGGCCVELFRRAICDRNDRAWQILIEQYRGVVLSWVRRHSWARRLNEDDDYWVDGAFIRFYQAVSPERFSQFSSISQILRYLKLCLDSAVYDLVRSFRQDPPTVPIDGDGDAREDSRPTLTMLLPSRETADQATDARELWAVILSTLRSDVERRVAYLTFILDYKPREIQALYPETFATTATVYPVIRNLLDRLQRSPHIREFLQ